MASVRDIFTQYFKDNNIEDDQGNIYTPVRLVHLWDEPPEDWGIELPGIDHYPTTIAQNLPNNSIATIQIPTNDTETDTITFTLKDGNYCEIDYTIEGDSNGKLVQLNCTSVRYYNDQGVQDTSIGGSFYMNTATMNAGELDGWTGNGEIGIYFCTTMGWRELYNPDTGEMEGTWNDCGAGFVFMNTAYEDQDTIPYPIMGITDTVTAAGQIHQYRLVAATGIYDGSEAIADKPQVAHYLNWVDGGFSPKEVPGEDTTAGDEGKPGGGSTGPVELKSDNVLPDDLPTISVQNLGIFGVYKLSANRVQALSSFLWSTNFYDNVIKNFASPMENIISFGILPFNPSVGADTEIHVGNTPTGVTGFKLSQLLYMRDCGTVSLVDIGKNWDTFADYEPYAELWLFLPYIGIVQIPTEDVARKGSIRVQYKLDAFSGACVAEILTYTVETGWNFTGSYSGNCLTQFPLSNASYLGMYGALAGSTLGAVVNAAAGNYAGALVSAAGSFFAKPAYGRSGSVSNVAGLLTKQKPYLIKASPKVIGGENLRRQHGYVSNLQTNINSGGFIRGSVNQVKLSGISNATQAELDEIQQLICNGIYA